MPLPDLRIGVDVASISAVANSLDRWGRRYAEKLYTHRELAETAAAPGRLAARFAAKEATIKVLQPRRQAPAWRDIEIRLGPGGVPQLRLRGRAADLAVSSGLGPWSLSMSHEGGIAVAVVVAAGTGIEDRGSRCGVRSDTAGRGRLAGTGDHFEERTSMEEKIRVILADLGALAVKVDDLGDDDDLYRHGLTSHGSVDLMLAIEDAFEIEFPDALLRRATFSSISNIRAALDSLGCGSDG